MARDYYNEALEAGKHEEQQQAATIRNNFYVSANDNPDAEAKVRNLARHFNLPVEVVRDNVDSLRSRAAASGIDVDAIVNQTPRTAQFLSNQENVAVSHDDTQNLTTFESLINSFKRGVPGLKQNLNTTGMRINARYLESIKSVEAQLAAGKKPEQFKMDDDPYGVAWLTPEQRNKVKEQAGQTIRSQAQNISDLEYQKAKIPQPAVVGRVMQAGKQEGFRGALREFYSDPVKFIASIGPESMVANAPAMIAAIPATIAGGPVAGGAVMGAGSYATDYESSFREGLVENGIDIKDPQAVTAAMQDPKLVKKVGDAAAAHALVVGAFDAASGGLAGKSLVPSRVFAKSPIAREITNIGLQIPVQGTLGAAGEAGGQILAGQKLDAGNILAEFVGESFGAPVDVAAFGYSQVRERLRAAKEGEETKQFVQGIVTAAEESKVRARDPETFRQFVASTTDGTPAQDLYISANALQQSGVADEVSNLLPSVAEQLPTALASNSYIRIPTDEYVTNIAGTKLNDALVDNLKLDPNSYTFAESKEYETVFNQEMTTKLEKMMTEKAGDEQFKSSRDAVRDQFVNDLNTAGRFTPEANRAYADMLASFYAVQAAKIAITPEEMVKRYQLGVVNKAVEGGQQFDQNGNMTPEFKQWFGDSKVVDNAGKPLRVYHGTNADIDTFRMANSITLKGAFFADNVDVANGYAGDGSGANVVPTYLSIRNPATQEDMSRVFDGLPASQTRTAAQRTKLLQKAGYDGAVYDYSGDASNKYYVAFSPEQAKSVFNERPTNNPGILNQDALIGEGEVKRVLRREPGDFTAEEQAAWDDFMSQRPDADRVMDNLEKYKGTPWAKQAVEGVFTRQAMRMLINGQQPNFQSSLDSKQVKRVRETLERRGLDGLWSLLEADGGMIGGAAKPVNNVNSSFINCDPSQDCAKYCYATKGNYQYANVIVKSELVTLAVEMDAVRSAQRVANEYKATAEYANDKALRLFDKGDGNMAWLPFISELNKQGIRTQIFSKVPEFLRQVPEMNLRLLSIDDSNMELAEQNQDLPVAFVYTGKEQIDALAKMAARGQVQVVLPVKLGQKLLDGSEIKELKNAVPAIKPYLCPIDSGFKKLGKTSQPGMWNCTKCDKNGGVGCFHGSATKAVMDSLEAKPATPQDRAQRILELRKQINELTATTGANLATAGQLPSGRVEGLLSEVDSLLGELLRDYEPGQQGRPALEIGSGTVNEVSSAEDNLSGSGRRVIPIKQLNQDGNAAGDSQSVEGNQLDQPARGQISFGDDITRQPSIIALLKDADLSTFIHEGGHFFLQVQADLASRIEAQGGFVSEGEQSIVDDMNKVLNWFGINGTPEMTAIQQWMSMSLEEQRPYHEQWARGFEAYAFDGKAPTLELQSVFQSFRAWMLNIYKQLKNLNVELSDEVRGVMDRMLATTEQIQAAEAARNMGPLFTPQNAQGIIDDWQAYHELGVAATQIAIDELQARGLKDMQWLGNARSRKLKELQKTVKLLRNQAMMDARREVMSQPLYRAWQYLTSRISEDDKIKQAEKRKSSLDMVDPSIDSLFTAIAKLGGIDREQARAQWGLDPKEKAPSPVFGKPVLRAKEGRALDDIAQALAADGYITTDEDGKYDLNELEEKFLDELAGRTQYSVFVDPTIFMEEGLPGQGLNLDVMAAGRFDSVGLTSLGLPPEMMERIKDLKMVAKDGIHPDLIAEQFGFSSGDELARTIAESPKPNEAIEAMTDQMMLERHGDLATPEGLQRAIDESLHNDVRMRALHAEAKALDTAMRVRGDTGRTNAKGQKITYAVLPRAAREFAENLIARMKVRDLKPAQFTAAEVKAAKAAERAYNKDDIETAAQEKRNQIINSYAAKAAMNAQDEVLKAAAYFRKFEKRSKSLDPDYYDQIVQLLERFDFAKSTTLKAIDKRTSLAGWLAAQREAGIEPNIPPELEFEANRMSYKDMTVEELRGLRDTVEQIEHLGRLKSKLLAAQDAREFAAIRDDIVATIQEYAGDRQANNRTSNTLSGQALQSVKKFWASHIKVATWARIMDGGKDGGKLWEYIIAPANARGDMEVEMRKKATVELSALVAPVLKEGKMGGKGMFFSSIGRSLNKEARLAIALNMGNASNMQRLLGGEDWTMEKIKPVLDTLTAADWTFVQNVWDYFESYRPMIAEKERRVYGKEPNWIEAQPLTVQTADNQIMQLRGGYYPVKFDPQASERAESNMDAEEARRGLQGAYTSATTRRSYTKQRAEAVVGRPLLYSLDGIYQGVNEVIHDLAWHEWLIDTNRLVKNPKIAEAMREHYGAEVHQQFKSWLKDVAEGDRGAANAGEKALGWIRQGVSVTGLGFNVMSALTQPFGLTQSIVRIGAKYVGKGMTKFMAAPRETANEIYAMSSFMENRALTRMRELAEVRNQVKGQSQARAAIDAGAYTLMLRAQQLVDIPTWWGAYEKATAEGNDQDRAVALADQAVIDSQASGTTKDLAAIERGGPALKLFTTFYTFFNAALNIGVERTMTREARDSSRAKLAADYLLLYVVPVIFVKAMKDALTPGDSDDWEDPESIAKMVLREEIGFILNMIFGVRELSNITNAVSGKPGGEYGGPSGMRMIGDTYKLAKEVGQGEADDGLRKAIVNLGSELLRLPGAQINRTITGAEALSEGKTNNPAALLFGYQK